jgi:hypothetical protein
LFLLENVTQGHRLALRSGIWPEAAHDDKA